MKKYILIFWVSLFSVIFFSNKSGAEYNFFGRFVPEGTPKIDGVISTGEWKEMGHLTLYKFFGEDSKIEIYVMWDVNYLYLGAEIEDYELWVDNFNLQTPWISTWDDDAFKWEIDPDYSRDENIQPDDRVFAINADGTACRLDKGDGLGHTVGVWIDPNSTKIKSAAKVSGILNDYNYQTLVSKSQKDKGFVVEVAIAWDVLFENAGEITLGDGYSLGMNFTNIEDDSGGALDPEYH